MNNVDVFISYRRSDELYATLIFDKLKQRGISVWYDKLIEPGDTWRDSIAKNISNARLMLVLISEEALKSSELKKELLVPKFHLGTQRRNSSFPSQYAKLEFRNCITK